MKWVNIFRKKRCKEDSFDSEDELGDLRSTVDSSNARSKRRSISLEPDKDGFHHNEKRTSLEKWQDARHARNSVDGQSAAPRTIGTLTVSKAGDTTILNNTYIMIKNLGAGTYGKVKLCFNIKDQKLYAVKSCRKSQFTQTLLRQLDKGNRRRLGPMQVHAVAAGTHLPQTIERRGFTGAKICTLQEAKARLSNHLRTEDIVREIAILKKLQHPNIVSLVEVIDDPRTDSLLLVMEYVEGSTLEMKQLGLQSWEPMEEQDVWWSCREVLQGLEYLHFHTVVHGDVKPANLLRDSNSGRIKITDFSSSTAACSHDSLLSGSSSFQCTPAFRPPESLVAGYRPAFQMDMWALGVCLYQWAFGELPFAGPNACAVYDRIRTSPVALPASPRVSTHLQDLILRLLDKNPATRLDVTAAMSHPWVTQGGDAPLVGLAGHRGWSESDSETGGPMEVTQEEMDAAIQAGDDAAHLLDNIFQQHLYQKREHLATWGEAADKIFLIAQGEVEIYRSALTPDAPTAPIISGLPDSMAEDEPVSDFVDVPAGAMPLESPLPAMQRQCSGELTRRATVEGFRLLAVRGPGESLGLGPLHRDPQHPHMWQASVRAKDQVLAFVAEVEDVLQLLKEHPEMEGVVAQICAQQQTDMMVADAMRQLRLSYPAAMPRHCEAAPAPVAAATAQCLLPSL